MSATHTPWWLSAAPTGRSARPDEPGAAAVFRFVGTAQHQRLMLAHRIFEKLYAKAHEYHVLSLPKPHAREAIDISDSDDDSKSEAADEEDGPPDDESEYSDFGEGMTWEDFDIDEFDPETRMYRKIKHWEGMAARENDPAYVKQKLTVLSAENHVGEADDEIPSITYRVLSRDDEGRIDYKKLDGYAPKHKRVTLYRRQLNFGRMALDPHAQQSWHPTTIAGGFYHDLDFYTTTILLNMSEHDSSKT